ncbi:hypothetical protein GW17_00043542 [Ensete ventricosum]|nr:hypothetical protein GW17_00043542 [Ensete ventricosum]
MLQRRRKQGGEEVEVAVEKRRRGGGGGEEEAAVGYKSVRILFAISTCTARYGRYISVCQVTGTRTARYRAVPPKIDLRRQTEEEIDRRRLIEGEIDRRWSIEGEIDRRRSIEEENGKKKKKRREERIPRSRAVAATGSPLVAFSPARGDGASPRTWRKIEATLIGEFQRMVFLGVPSVCPGVPSVHFGTYHTK